MLCNFRNFYYYLEINILSMKTIWTDSKWRQLLIDLDGSD